MGRFVCTQGVFSLKKKVRVCNWPCPASDSLAEVTLADGGHECWRDSAGMSGFAATAPALAELLGRVRVFLACELASPL